MKTIFSKEKYWEYWHCFTFLQISLINTRWLDSHICSCFQSVVMCCFDWSEWRQSSTQIYGGKGNFKRFFRQLWVFFFDTTTKLTNGGFLKVSCYVEFETVSKNLSNSVILKSTDLSCTWNYLYIILKHHPLVIWQILIPWIM